MRLYEIQEIYQFNSQDDRREIERNFKQISVYFFDEVIHKKEFIIIFPLVF